MKVIKATSRTINAIKMADQIATHVAGGKFHKGSLPMSALIGSFNYTADFLVSVSIGEENYTITMAEGICIAGLDIFSVAEKTDDQALGTDGYVFLKITCDGSDPNNPVYSGDIVFVESTGVKLTDLDIQTSTEYYKLIATITDNSPTQNYIEGVMYLEGRIF